MKKFDISKMEAQPDHNDVCKVKCFDQKRGKTVDGPRSIFDASRGVFFKDPGETSQKRAQYKSERVWHVTDFEVVKAEPEAPAA